MSNKTAIDQALAAIREEVAAKRAAADVERDPIKRDRHRRHARLREEVAEEEAEAIAAEAVENQQAALSLRVPTVLMAELRARADAEQISTSVRKHSGVARVVSAGVLGLLPVTADACVFGEVSACWLG
jgi:GAF domain-containing protein